MNKNRIESVSLLVLFAVVSVLLFFVFAPFIQVLALAAVFALLFQGTFKRIAHEFLGWRDPAAAVVVALVFLFIIAPLFLLGVEIFREAQGIYASLQGSGPQYLGGVQAWIERPVQQFLPGFSFDIYTYVGGALGFISSNLAGLVYQTLFVIFETFLMLLALFFFLRDGDRIAATIDAMSPLGKAATEHILTNLQQTVQSVVRGTLLIALMRWIIVGLGFYFFGIPNAILWGSVGGIIGAIPGVGTLLVFIPAIIYLFVEGQTLGAIGLTAFAVVALVVLDNVLTPYFFRLGLEAPQIFVLFSILGGILYFGPLGFIFGPLVFSVFLSLVRVYGQERARSVRRIKQAPERSQS